MSERDETAHASANWAKPVEKLTAAGAPDGALEPRRRASGSSGPIQGFGKLWQKTYKVRARRRRGRRRQEVIAAWRQSFPSFWPKGNDFYPPLTGVEPGEVALLTGAARRRHEVLDRRDGALRRRGVVHADDAGGPHVRRLDHVLGVRARAAPTVAQTQVLMRAQDPLSELGLTLGGHGKENKFWERDAAALAARFGVEGAPETTTGRLRRPPAPVVARGERPSQRGIRSSISHGESRRCARRRGEARM